jgi:glucan phosphorylase
MAQQWNETYVHYHKEDPKQTYYLSMEYLQGRALTNAIGNLDIQDAYGEALNQLGHQLEDIVEQVIISSSSLHQAFYYYLLDSNNWFNGISWKF